MSKREQQLDQIRKFYDEEYYSALDREVPVNISLPWHSRRVASRLGHLPGMSVLDIACGRGEWLAYLQQNGCSVSGIDLSSKAIKFCQSSMPAGHFVCGPAESLPFADDSFDLVTCLGSLEHFTDKPLALREMLRVAKPDAKFLVLVPNAGFLTRRLGLYRGTNQAKVKEDVYSLGQWKELLESAGLSIISRWRDLHMLNPRWIKLGNGLPSRIARTLQALALMAWPLDWQYQVYFYCERRESGGD